jgi:acyl-coenzyme A synthetase/AMP-(fatty) acid ligase
LLDPQAHSVWLVDEIPANERGKISRRELARCYAVKREG